MTIEQKGSDNYKIRHTRFAFEIKKRKPTSTHKDYKIIIKYSSWVDWKFCWFHIKIYVFTANIEGHTHIGKYKCSIKRKRSNNYWIPIMFYKLEILYTNIHLIHRAVKSIIKKITQCNHIPQFCEYSEDYFH